MIRIIWSNSSVQDLDEIVSRHAESFADVVDSSIQQLTQQPQSGRVIPELDRQNITKYREVVLPPWRLFYTQESDHVVIHAVIDGRRNIEDILLRRNLR